MDLNFLRTKSGLFSVFKLLVFPYIQYNAGQKGDTILVGIVTYGKEFKQNIMKIMNR